MKLKKIIIIIRKEKKKEKEVGVFLLIKM